MTRTQRSSYTSPVAPDKKKRRLYARTALKRMQVAHGLREVFHLWQDEILEPGCVADERVGRGHSLHGRVQPWEALVGDAGGDLGAVTPRLRILVRNQHLVGLDHRRPNRFPIHGREREIGR